MWRMNSVRSVLFWLCIGLIAGLSYWPVGRNSNRWGKTEYEVAFVVLLTVTLFVARVRVWWTAAVLSGYWYSQIGHYLVYGDFPVPVISWLALTCSALLIARARVPHRLAWACAGALFVGFVITHGVCILHRRRLMLFDLPVGIIEAAIGGLLLASLGVKTIVFQYTQSSQTCRKCGYFLWGLPENRCPECGTEWHPNESYPRLVRRSRLPRP